MAIGVLQAEARLQSPADHVTSLHETVETIRNDALEYALAKFAPPLREMGTVELLKRHDFFDYFRNGLAKGVAATLAANDESVHEVYFFEPNLNPDSETEESIRPDTSIDLLVRAHSRSAALEAFVAALDRALTYEVKELPSDSLARISSILHVMFISEEDIARRKGYAPLLDSMFAKPRRIWQRD